MIWIGCLSCKGPFPGPSGSIHDYKPVSSPPSSSSGSGISFHGIPIDTGIVIAPQPIGKSFISQLLLKVCLLKTYSHHFYYHQYYQHMLLNTFKHQVYGWMCSTYKICSFIRSNAPIDSSRGAFGNLLRKQAGNRRRTASIGWWTKFFGTNPMCWQ